MSTLIFLNDPPYGTERSYNGLRLAKSLLGKDENVTLFLLADAVFCAKAGQTVPQGFYNVELMINAVVRKGSVLLCGTCMDARGLKESEVIAGCKRSTLDELTENTLNADKVLTF
ncbi:hypothetical protein BOV91_02035 [Solemya velum gill symbiont]|nr:hypothetical protein BOV91_02035 [Solemya velum gill symbiont]